MQRLSQGLTYSPQDLIRFINSEFGKSVPEIELVNLFCKLVHQSRYAQ